MARKIYSKTCYAFNPATGEYQGETLAYLDPATPDQYNLPASATWLDPDDLGDWGNSWPVWNGTSWSLVTVEQ